MVHRNSRGFFGDIVVFPGGRVDDLDVPAGHTLLDDLSHRNAALRELAEETGILVIENGSRPAPGLKERALHDWLTDRKVTLAVDRLVLVSRWVTPEGAPRRFDTRFYVLECVDPPPVAVDADELIGHEWITPHEALRRVDDGVWSMILPTIAHLRWLRRWSSVEETMRSAAGADGRTLIIPRRVDDGSLLPIHLPAESP